MGFFAKAAEIVKVVIDKVNKAVDWFSDPDNREKVRDTAQFILSIIQAVSTLNEPIPNRDRPKVVRTTVEIMQRMSPDDLREIATIKEKTDIDTWTSAQLDGRIGRILEGYIEEKNEKEGKTA